MSRFIFLFVFSLVLFACSDSNDDSSFAVNDDSVDAPVQDSGDAEDNFDEVDDSGSDFPPSGTSTSFFIPDNCDNPPTQISAGDGFTCIASRTRNDSLVCLLPYQFTWSPLTSFTDDAGFTFGCNANDDFFDEVTVILNNGRQISLVEAGCFNFVATPEGQIGRQHWRNEGVQFDSVSGALDMMIMTRDGQSTCLRF